MENKLIKVTEAIKVKYGWSSDIHIEVQGKKLVVREFDNTKKGLKSKIEKFDIQRYYFDEQENSFLTK